MRIKVIFVCLGNICRSPMAELYFKHIVKCDGLEDSFDITSFGTSDEEKGNSIYPPAAATLARYGICGEHRAARITYGDIADADYVLAMDGGNMRALERMTGGRFKDRMFRLCDFTTEPRDVADPWYTRNFEKAFSDIREGCEGFLAYLKQKGAI